MTANPASAQKQGNDACRWMVILGIGLLALILLSVKYDSQSDGDLLHSNPPAPPKVDTGSKDNLCTTKGCTEAAASIISKMNPAVDPCENFHEFACGKYNEQHDYNVWQGSRRKLVQQLLELILNNKSGMRAVEKARTFHENCEMLKNANFTADLHKYVKKFGELRLIDQKLEAGMEMPSITDTALMSTLHYYQYNSRDTRNDNAFFSINANIEEFLLVQLNQPGVVLFDFSRSFVKVILESTVRDRVEEAVAAIEALGFTVSKEGRKQNVDELVTFYMKIVKLHHGWKYSNDQSTIGELQKAAPAFDWLRLLGSYLPHRRQEMNGETELALMNLKSIKELSEILLETPRHVVQNFFFLNWARHLRDRFENRGKMACKSRLLYTFRKLAEHLAIGTIRFESDVEDVKNLGKEMRRVFHQIFDENTWLEPETKAVLHKRLDNVKEHYGFSTHALDKAKIDGFYEALILPDKWGLMEMWQFEERGSWFVTRLNLMGTLGYEPAMEFNAFNSNDVKITIPLALITQPFYNPTWPLEFNYGGVGEVIGHEFTHTFDDQDDLPDGNVGNDTDEYLEKEKCFVDQFGGVIYGNDRLNITVKADGNVQHKETIADNNGLRVAWRAYLEKRKQLYGRNPPKLPGLQEFTNEQLFFLAHTQIECGRQPRIYPNQDHDWVGEFHPVGNVRINEKLKNFNSFATTFKCKLNSTMNPERKCRVWRYYH